MTDYLTAPFEIKFIPFGESLPDCIGYFVVDGELTIADLTTPIYTRLYEEYYG